MILDKLSEIAVLGTSKKAIKPELLEWGKQYKLSSGNVEQYLLQSAYLDLQMREAGKILVKEEELKPIECIEDETNAVDDNYIYHLKQILKDFPNLVLPYIERLIAAKKTLPASVIPMFLDFAKRQEPDFKKKIIVATGNRAAFLTKFSNDWDFPSASEINWETSTHTVRLVFARNLRNTEPQRAVEFIQLSFNEEHSKERLELLECLKINPGEYDKAFLQECMKDKSQQVVQVAFECLLKLDVKQLKLLQKEVAPYFKFIKGGFLTSNRIEINLPENNEGFLKNLGSCSSAGINLGKKAIVLHRIISRLPIEYYGVEYADLIKVAERSEWKAMLLSAWQNAAIMYANSQWGIDLMPALIKHNVPFENQLIQLLNNEEFNRVLKMLFSGYPKSFRSKETIGLFLKCSNHEIDQINAETGIRMIAEFLQDISIKGEYLHHEDKKVLFDFFARIPWKKTELPEILEEYKELIDIKQKLLKSIQ